MSNPVTCRKTLKDVHSFLHPTDFLEHTCGPSAVLGTGDTTVNNTGSPRPCGAHSRGGEGCESVTHYNDLGYACSQSPPEGQAMAGSAPERALWG